MCTSCGGLPFRNIAVNTVVYPVSSLQKGVADRLAREGSPVQAGWTEPEAPRPAKVLSASPPAGVRDIGAKAEKDPATRENLNFILHTVLSIMQCHVADNGASHTEST